MKIEFEHIAPRDIEKESMRIIREEFSARKMVLDPANEAVIMRCIHTSADFDYAENLTFSKDAVTALQKALLEGAYVVTDTRMAYSGISKGTLAKYGGRAFCFMSDDDVAAEAKTRGVTRASVSMEKAARLMLGNGLLPDISKEQENVRHNVHNKQQSEKDSLSSQNVPAATSDSGILLKGEQLRVGKEGANLEDLQGAQNKELGLRDKKAVFAIGNAPTALIELRTLMDAHKEFRPAGIVGVPVGFVNVVSSKELIIESCEQYGIPYIVARGRKGGSNIAAAIINALLYGMGKFPTG